MPSSNAYDFIGAPSHGLRASMEEETVVEESVPKEEEPVKEEEESAPVEEESNLSEEDPVIDNQLTDIPQEETSALPEPQDIPEQEKKPSYYELSYYIFLNGNAMEKLPPSDNGNYVIIYRTQYCSYCDQLIWELKKGNIEGYTLVFVMCSGGVQDVFMNRWIAAYPSFIIIKNNRVKYYGYGYRSLEQFKRYLQ